MWRKNTALLLVEHLVCYSFSPRSFPPEAHWFKIQKDNNFGEVESVESHHQIIPTQRPAKVACFCNMGVSKIGVPQNGWFIRGNPLKWMIWGYHYFRKQPQEPCSKQMVTFCDILVGSEGSLWWLFYNPRVTSMGYFNPLLYNLHFLGFVP